jgi:uncharacterized protein YcgI (DUF1989 family)
MSELEIIPARRGGAARLRAGQSIRIVNTEGGQVADFWAFRAEDPSEHMSMPHSVVCIGRIKPKTGDVLVTNLRRPVMELIEDTSPGVHCMLFAACDVARYELLGFKGRHDNCADNLRHAVAPFQVPLPYIPTPLNLFMNTKFHDHAVMAVEPPGAKAGDSVTFRALQDCIVALSSCPQDLVPVNAHDCTPKPIGYAVLPPGSGA